MFVYCVLGCEVCCDVWDFSRIVNGVNWELTFYAGDLRDFMYNYYCKLLLKTVENLLLVVSNILLTHSAEGKF